MARGSRQVGVGHHTGMEEGPAVDSSGDTMEGLEGLGGLGDIIMEAAPVDITEEGQGAQGTTAAAAAVLGEGASQEHV